MDCNRLVQVQLQRGHRLTRKVMTSQTDGWGLSVLKYLLSCWRYHYIVKQKDEGYQILPLYISNSKKLLLLRFKWCALYRL